MKGISAALLNGIHERGEGGVLWVRGEECRYCFPNEFGSKEFEDGLVDMLSREESSSIFFAVVEDEGKMHVMAIPKQSVYDEVRREVQKEEATLEEVGAEVAEEKEVAKEVAEEVAANF